MTVPILVCCVAKRSGVIKRKKKKYGDKNNYVFFHIITRKLFQ